MKCPRCQVENRPQAKFCEECGASLARTCGNCGSSVSATAKFCAECGQPAASAIVVSERFVSPQAYTPKHLAERILNSKSALEGERKQVTVLFADLKGSMELLADRDPEDARKLLDPVLERMMEAVHRYEGTVNQVMGDGIMALFGAPLAHEDHAVRACYAALAMQSTIHAYSEQAQRTQGLAIWIRVGLNSGEVVVRVIGGDLHMDYTAVGQTTHLAARMEQLAAPGSTLLTAATLELVEGFVSVKPRGPVPVKGMSEPVEVYELTGAGAARSRLQAAAARGLTKFVGRTAELSQLNQALERAQTGHGEIVAVVGEPGVGKSRLFYELTHSHRMTGLLVLEAGSVSYGKATAYRPVIDLLKVYFGIEERDDSRRIREKVTGKLLTLDRQLEALLSPLLSLLDVPAEDSEWQLLDPAQKRLRILEACKRLLMRETQVQPLVVVFEDLHWIDSETQTLLDSLVEALPVARLLLLVNYRPEYQHHWGAKTYYAQVRIDPLRGENAEALLHALLGDDASVLPLKSMLIERTEGNPLFLEESVRTLVEAGDLQGSRGAYRLGTHASGIEVPATVQAILAARIDRLSPEDKRLLQAAAVVGKDVPFSLLQAIAELPEASLRQALIDLQAAEFVYEVSLFPDLEYTFKHALTHEVAYGSLLQERRRALHARILDAMEQLYAARLNENVEQFAHHAFRGEVWQKAVTYSRRAAEKAFARSANREAVTLYEHVTAALAQLSETRETLEQAIDVRLVLRSSLIPLCKWPRLLECAREAERMAKKLGDPLRMGWAYGTLGLACNNTGDSREAEEYDKQALAVAMQLGDRRLVVACENYILDALTFQGDYRRAIEFFRHGMQPAQHSVMNESTEAGPGPVHPDRLHFPYYAVLSKSVLTWCFAELGEFESALEQGIHAERLAADLGLAYMRGYAAEHLGLVYLRKGDLERAMPLLEHSMQISREADIPVLRLQCAWRLGYALNTRNRLAQSIRLLEEARALGIGSNNAMVHAHLGEAYGLVGRREDGLAELHDALAMADRYHQHGSRSWALYLLGNLRATGSADEKDLARTAYRDGMDLAKQLGMRPLVGMCHLALAMLADGGKQERREHVEAAARMFREMDMQSWLEKAEVALNALS
jgi:class 3 adenylate cyclase/tetratricopeptide (TPR) repeat protein